MLDTLHTFEAFISLRHSNPSLYHSLHIQRRMVLKCRELGPEQFFQSFTARQEAA